MKITEELVNAANSAIAEATTTAGAFRLTDALSRTMLARLLDLNHVDADHVGLGVAGCDALARVHGWDPADRADDRPADGRGPCRDGWRPRANRPDQCRNCDRRRIDHRPARTGQPV